MHRVLTSVRVFGFQGISRTPADNARCRTGPGSGRYFLRVLLIKEDAFLRRHPAQEIESVSPYWTQNSREGCGSLNSDSTRSPRFLSGSSRVCFRCPILEDTEVLAQPCAPQRWAHLMLYSIWFLSFSPSSNQVTTLSPGAVRHRPAIPSGRPFCPHLRKFKGDKLLADQREIEGKSEESDWFR